MGIVLDTSVVIDHLRDLGGARLALARAVKTGDRIVGSTLTRMEVLAGMRPSESVATHRLLNVIEWIPVDIEVADRAGELANTYMRSHSGVDPVDYIVASTAITHRCSLWTMNVKHFPMFPGLTRPY